MSITATAADTLTLSAPTMTAATNSGVSSTDHITKVTRPVFAGNLDAGLGLAGYTMSLYDGTTKVGAAIVQAAGGWSILSGTLSEGAHSMSLVLTDPAGNVVGASPARPIEIITHADAPSAPVLSASVDSGISDSDHVTNVNFLSFNGTAAAGASVELYDSGVYMGKTVADSQGRWLAENIFLDDGQHRLTAVVIDIAGNISPPSTTLQLMIDTEAPQVLALALDAGSDTGADNGDGVTGNPAPVVTGRTEAGASVALLDGQTQIGTAVADAQGNWHIVTAPFSDGAHHLTVTITDVAGNLAVQSGALTIVIDTSVPLVPGAPLLATQSDSGESDADGITNVATPLLSGSAEAGATVTLYDGERQVGTAVADAHGAWQSTAAALTDGVHSLTARVTDAAGNVSAASPALVLTIDTAAPPAPAGLDLLAVSDSGSSDSDNITNATRPLIAGQAEAGARVALYDGDTLVGSGVADADGHWQVGVNADLSNGVHHLAAQATDAAGNLSARSEVLSITIDTRAAAAPSALALLAADDSGASHSDQLTNVAAPTVTGKAEAGATVSLFEGGLKLGSAVADANGDWRIASSVLTDGAHHLTASTSALTGTVSPLSEALVITIDTQAPATPGAPLLAAQSDSGLSSADGITNLATPLLSGTAEVGTVIALFDGALQVGAAVADAQGAWSATSAALADGEHRLTVRATDAAGNQSAASPVLTLTIDTAAPAAPAGLDLLAGSDSGSSDTDNITSSTQPVIGGSAEAGAQIALYDGDTLVGSGLADASGHWQIGVSALSNGVHDLTAQATDAAGNLSPRSPVLNLTIDTRLPLAPTGLDLATASDRGLSNSDNITNLAAPIVTGQAEAGATVSLFDGDLLLGRAVADANGGWSIASATLADGVHHLTASTSALTGVVSPLSAALVVTIDTAAPATSGTPLLAAQSDSGLSNTDGITNAATPLLSGSAEAGTTVALFDGAVQVASAVANADGVWRIADRSFGDGVHQLTVTATDIAGNVSAASAVLRLTIDQSAPVAPGQPDLLAASDHGASDTDNITNVALPTLAGQAEANAGITLYDGATVVGSTVADAGGNWQLTVAQPLANGAHSLTVKATDAAGNTSVASAALLVTINAAALSVPSTPVLAPASDSGALNSDKLTNITTPLLTGTAAPNATVALYDGDTAVATTTANAAGAWSVTTGKLADGVHHLSVGAIDQAGNASPRSAALVVTIDTAAPATPGAPLLEAASDSGRSSTDGITNDTTPTVGGSAEAGATVKLYDGATQVGSAVADADGVWRVTSSALTASAHSLTVQVTDLAGNVSAASPLLALSVDTSAPAAPTAPDLLTASDSGASSVDNITNVVLPTIAGKAEANASVSLFDGTTLIGTGLADANGNWQITVAQPLATGVHSLTAQAADAAGNLSPKSSALSVTIDTTALATPTALDLVSASDRGISSVDNITNLATPTISGGGPAGATVNLYDGDTLVGSVVANVTSGAWSIASSALADGVHALTARTVDPAGNLSAPSAVLTVTIDTAAPVAPALPLLDPLSDTGSSGTDGLTNDTTPTLSGSAEAGTTVKLFDGATQVGSTVADTQGAWSITASTLAAGVHNLSASATDVAGNISAASPALTLTIDTAAVAPSGLDLPAAFDSGVSSTDNQTNITLPTIVGKAEAGSSIALFDGAVLVGAGVADAGGNWQIAVTQPLSEGAHTLTAQATDAAGNLSAKSSALSLSIDLTPFATPTGLDLAAGSDKGVSSTDNITNLTTPTISGNARPGITVNLYDGDTFIKTAVADVETGVWSVAIGPLTDGVHQLSARTLDPAGNLSAPSIALAVTIDTAAPAAPGAPVLDAASDSGVSSTDGLTNDTTPTVSGTAEAGATVRLYDGVTQVGAAVANADGVWSITSIALAVGVHSLTAKATDVAGNVSAASPALALTVDTVSTAPGALDLLAESDSGTSNSDNLTNVALPSITGKAEANAAIALFDGTTLIGTGLADANGNWQITSTVALADGVHSLGAQATDAAGNLSTKTTLSVTIDTTPLAAPGVLDLATGSDRGASNSDNLTNLATPTINGTAPANAIVNLYDGGLKVGTAVAASNGAWSIATSTLADGVHQLTAVTVDPAGNVSAPSAALAVTIDTAAPALPAAPLLDAASDSGSSNADGITNDTTPTLSGSAEVGATVKLFDGATQVGSAVANADGAWSITTSALAVGAHSLTATATDSAGNVSPVSPATTVTIDTAAVAPNTLDLIAAADSGTSNTDNLTNVVLPTIAGKGEANASIALFDGTTLIGTGVADASGNWQITSTVALADGAHILAAQATDLAGNLSTKTTLSITIDTVTLAAPTALDLATASDKGVSSIDNITNLATPTISGSAPANAVVNLYDGDVKVGTAVATSTGAWSIATSALADGAHQLSAVTVDPAGNVSAPSVPLVVTIDTVAPLTPAAPLLDAASDNGRSNTDRVTNDATPTVSGSAEAGATVALFDGATQVGSAVANAEGAWSITASALTAAVHNLTVKATDIAGNPSAAAPVLAVTVDLAAPAAPTALDLLATSDSGLSSVDNITNVVLPTIAGKAEVNAIVALFDGATLIGTALADAGGNWQITVGAPLADGVHSLTAQATDLAGNQSVKSATLSVTIDTAAPSAPAALDLATASDKGVSSIDNLTNLATPTLTGSAEAGATVTLYEGDIKLGSAVANSAGVWSLTSSKLGDGVHHLTASATDVAGNLSTPSDELVVEIDTLAPVVGTPLLAAASDTGRSSTDGITNDTTPTVGGSAEVGATMALFDGATQVGSAVADAEGAWSITASTLAAGAHSLTVKATDAAGNVSATSAALALTIDVAAPAVPTALDLVTAADSGGSSTDNLTNVVLPTLTGKAEANATVTLFDGATIVGSGLANASGVWTITLTQPLADGVHGFSAQATDVAGNSSAKTAVLNVTIDATAPDAPSGLDLPAAADKGVSSTDNITNQTASTITGNAAAGAVVTVFDGATKLGAATANSAGVWSYATGTLLDGVHSLTASTVDLAGNLSLPSAALDLTIDTKLAVSAANLTDASDSGGVTNDNLTNVAQPVFTGTADAGATVSVYDSVGNKLLGTTVADGDGTWSFTSPTLADGVHSITTKATDLAGNAASGSTALSVTIDTVAPVLTDGNANANFANTGAAANSTVGVTASGAGAGASFVLLSNPGNLFAINSSGVVTMPNSALLTPGAHDITVQATDKAGNVGAAVVFTINTNTAPTISSIANVTTDEDTDSAPRSFTIGDSESAASTLTLSGSSAHGSVSFGGSGANRTVVFTPDDNWYGTTDVVVSVRDPGGMVTNTTFKATVLPVDDQSTPQADVVNGIEHGSASATKASLLANDTDPDLVRPTSVVAVYNVSGGSASLSGNNVVFTAGASAHGLGHYQYAVGDGGIGDVWVKLNPVNTDSDYSHEIQQMYIGYFNRPADKGGLAGKLGLIANMSAPDRKAALNAMGTEFIQSQEYLNTWGGLTDRQVVEKVYFNLFGRSGDQVATAEIDLWVARLATGTDLTRASLVWTIADSALNSDITTTLNKTLVAQYFTDQMTTQQNTHYINGASQVVMDYLNGVTSDNSTIITAAENTASIIVAATGVAKVAGGTVMAAQHAAADTAALTLQGTAGADQFVLDQQAQQLTVQGFSSAEGDHLLIQRALNGQHFAAAADVLAHSHVDGGDTVIELGQGHTVTLVGVTGLTAADITLVG